jgi:hypothetical protein
MKNKTFIESELKRIEQNGKLRYQSIKSATTLAKKENDRRLAGMNEFREALKDAQSTFVTRNESSIQHDRMENDIKFLREDRAKMEGKASMNSVVVVYVISILSLLITLIKLFM